jgi:hypothetical protein
LHKLRQFCTATLLIFLGYMISGEVSANPLQAPDRPADQQKVVVSHELIGNVDYVVGTIVVDQPPAKVWPILTNPFEFETGFCPRVKTIGVLVDKPNYSLMDCRFSMGFLMPTLKYTVATTYVPLSSATFQSTSGDIKDFRGQWQLRPLGAGLTEIKYCMYVQPGFFIPQWLVRRGLRNELPNTLIGLSDRIDAICNHKVTPVMRHLLASNAPAAHH